jgi:hypothetical protein
MNIFFLSFNPKTAAEYHCDKHVVKMILETAQLLYTAHWIASPRDMLPQNAYKQTHYNHPSAIWVRESLDNYKWLCELGLALCAEYTYRYKRRHLTQSHLEWLASHPPALPELGITKIRLAMPDEYKQPNPVKAYRAYYIGAKQRFLHYSGRSVPEFLSKTRITN